MKLLLSTFALLLLLAWFCERWAQARDRLRREREEGRKRRWWKEPPGDDLDGDY